MAHPDPAPAGPVPASTGMVRIGRSPARSGLLFVLPTTVAGALLLALVTAGLFGESPARYPLALAFWLVVLPGGILLYLAVAFRPVAVDFAAGLARLGRATVPLTSITTAWRETQVGLRGLQLSYRFVASTGAWGRVLVAGRPIRGLGEADRRRLAEFVARTAIAHPTDHDGLTPPQRYLLDSLSQYGAKTTVGKPTILAELVGEPIPEPGDPSEVTEETLRQWQRDDHDAEAFRRSQPLAARRARRLLGWIALAAIAGGLVVVLAAAMGERSAGGQLDSGTNDLAAAGLLIVAGTGLAAYLGYCVACYVNVRDAQRSALAWLRERGAEQAERGLPPVLSEAFAGYPPAHRLKIVGAFAAAVVGGGALIAAPVIYATEPDLPSSVSLSILLIGIGFTAISVAAFLSANRAKRRQQVFAVRLGGHRLIAEQRMLGL